MGRKSQRKGADGERELAAILREYGYEIKRGGSLSFGEAPDLADFMRLYDRQKVPETAEGKEMTNDTQKRKSPASLACVPYKGRSGTGGGDR